jgi:hypothetical protein
VIPDRSLRTGIAVTTLLAGALFALELGGPVRYVVVIAFVLACPGLAWARLLRLGDAADLAGIGITLSIALAALVGQTMALARWWSPGVGYLALAAITAAGISFEPRVPSEDAPADPASGSS